MGCHSDNIKALNIVRKFITQGKFERFLSFQIIRNNYFCNRNKINILNFWYEDILGLSMFVKHNFAILFCNNFVIFLISIFIECPIGFYGPTCSKPCRFPNYGLGCQRMCRCNESDCNNIIGCTVGMDTTVVTESYELGYNIIHFEYFSCN